MTRGCIEQNGKDSPPINLKVSVFVVFCMQFVDNICVFVGP